MASFFAAPDTDHKHKFSHPFHLLLLSFRRSHLHTQALWCSTHIYPALFHGRVADQHKSHLSHFGQNGALWEVQEIQISTRDLNFDLLLGSSPSFWEVRKHQSLSIRKTIQITQWIDQKSYCLIHLCFTNLLLTSGKVHIAKMHLFPKCWAPSFKRCVFDHLRNGRGRERKNTQGDRN